VTNESDRKIYVVVIIRSLRSQKTEVLHCFQQLINASQQHLQGGNIVNINPTIEWLQRKAAESLKIHTNVIRAAHGLLHGEHHEQLKGGCGTDVQTTDTRSTSRCVPS
jgi:hypothetical protein